jgi:hypothetical protein
MSSVVIFQTHLVLGYVAWLLCFSTYIWPKLKAMDDFEAQRAIATLHSFRFFGLVFILSGVVSPNLPASFATFARLLGFRNRRASHAGTSHGQDTPAVLAVCCGLQSHGVCRPDRRLLPRCPDQPCHTRGGIGCRLCDSNYISTCPGSRSRTSQRSICCCAHWSARRGQEA